MTTNRKPGDFPCIADALDCAATSAEGVTFWTIQGQKSKVLDYRQLRSAAMNTASILLGLGYERGDRIGLIAETGADFLITFYACQYAGMLACPLPASLHIGGKNQAILRLQRTARAATMAAIIGPVNFLALASAAVADLPTDALSYDALFNAEPKGWPVPLGANEPAYIQYSSGSTAEPKGVLVTQRAVNANAQGIIQQGLEAVAQDRCFSWLPFYHDMGLFGFSIAPLFAGLSVDYISPMAFARKPALWLELISANRSTISFAPSFAYKLAADRIGAAAGYLDLSSWRIAGVGADMISIGILDEFRTVMAPAGFQREAFLPSYGMAEAVLGVSFSRPSTLVTTQRLGRDTRRFVSCGTSLPGHDILIVDGQGNELDDGEEGHIWIRGPSTMVEYFADPIATQDVRRRESYLDTGDLGFMEGGEIFVTGRFKELIKRNGRSLWPQDIEWIGAAAAGLGTNDLVAFETFDDQESRLMLLVKETRIPPDERAKVSDALRTAINAGLGVTAEIAFVPPRLIPRTPSGKISRMLARQLFEAKTDHVP